VDDLARGLDDKGQTDMILLDFSKAFNKVPTSNYYLKLHAVVLQALSLLGLKTFCMAEPKKQYLKASQATGFQSLQACLRVVSWVNCCSYSYISDLLDCVTSSSTARMFSDDTVVYHHITSHDDADALQHNKDTDRRTYL